MPLLGIKSYSHKNKCVYINNSGGFDNGNNCSTLVPTTLSYISKPIYMHGFFKVTVSVNIMKNGHKGNLKWLSKFGIGSKNWNIPSYYALLLYYKLLLSQCEIFTLNF